MANTRKIGTEKKRAIIAAASTVAIVALLAALATPEVFRPSLVTITGTVTAPDVTLKKITFINTRYGTTYESLFPSNGETSGMFAIPLENEYSYDVWILWNKSEGVVVETKIGTLVLDTFNQSLVRNWAFEP